MERAIDASELMAEIQVCSWDSEQDRERAEDLVLGMPTLTPPNEWVSVKERRPQAGHDVIALLPCGDCAVVWWTGSVWRVRWDATQLDREPTHWMPLPAPPDRRPPEGEDGDANHA